MAAYHPYAPRGVGRGMERGGGRGGRGGMRGRGRGAMHFPMDDGAELPQVAPLDGKQLRDNTKRGTVNHTGAVIRFLEDRVFQRDYRQRTFIQPDKDYRPLILPPFAYPRTPALAVANKLFIHRMSTEKDANTRQYCARSPFLSVKWSPDGRRLISAAQNGQMSLWHGQFFNFETRIPDSTNPVRSIAFSHNQEWLITGDDGGLVTYYHTNFNRVKQFTAHSDLAANTTAAKIYEVTFAPTDQKIATCADNGSGKIFDFLTYTEEQTLVGHGSDVKSIQWHPYKGLIATGSKDDNRPVMLWDPKSGKRLRTLYGHKVGVNQVRWNNNGNWLLTGSKDGLVKLFDIRVMKEMQTFAAVEEVHSLAWHPVHESMFAAGYKKGEIKFWHVGCDAEIGEATGGTRNYTDCIWSLDWHPLGHVLASGSQDRTVKFWNMFGASELTDEYEEY